MCKTPRVKIIQILIKKRYVFNNPISQSNDTPQTLVNFLWNKRKPHKPKTETATTESPQP